MTSGTGTRVADVVPSTRVTLHLGYGTPAHTAAAGAAAQPASLATGTNVLVGPGYGGADHTAAASGPAQLVSLVPGRNVALATGYGAPSHFAVSLNAPQTVGLVPDVRVQLTPFYGTQGRYETGSGTRTMHQGDRVVVSAGYLGGGTPGRIYEYVGSDGASLNLGEQNYTGPMWVPTKAAAQYASGGGARTLVTGDTVRVTVGYAGGGTVDRVYRWVGASGVVRNLGAQNYATDPNWKLLGGEPGATYRYVGAAGPRDLNGEDYSNAGLWQKIGGTPGVTYRYLGAAGSFDLNVQDYSDASRWTPVAGAAGAIYRYVGAAGTHDLNAQDYTDSALWRQLGGAPGTSYQFVGSALAGAGLDLNAQDYSDTSLWAPLSSPPGPAVVDAYGEVRVEAFDSAGIFANIKLVSSSTTTNDGGAAVLQGQINNQISADFLSSEGVRTIDFGDRVRIATISEDHSTDDGEVEIATDETVRLADDYADARFTTASGKRVVVAGDDVELETDYANGGTPGKVYRYVGPSARLDLGEEDYTDTGLWVPVGGVAGGLYKYLGSEATLDLGLQDYSDAALWAPVGGDEGAVYEYLGTAQTVDLGAVDYTDLGFWKPVLATQLVPQGLNISPSDSMAIGGLVAYNDVRSAAKAYIDTASVSAGSLIVRALERAVIRATADSSVTSSGGSSFAEEGDSLAVSGVIATNTILSSAEAYVKDSNVRTVARAATPTIPATTGDAIVDAENISQIDAVTASATESAGNTFGITLAFNTIGWASQNFLFRAVDVLVGDPLIAEAFGADQPVAKVESRIVNSHVQADGDVAVNGLNEAAINAEVSNDASSIVVMVQGSKSFALGGVIASNMVNVRTRSAVELDVAPGSAYTPADTPTALLPGDLVQVDAAHVYRYVGNPRGPPISLATSDQNYATNPDWLRINAVSAGGSVTVAAEESATIDATSSLKVVAQAVSDAGLSIVSDLLTAALEDYQYTTNSGTRDVKQGELVRVADDYAGGGEGGKVYRYTGTGATLNLGIQNYAAGTWAKVVVGATFEFLEQLNLNVTASDAIGIGAIAVRNDVRGGVSSELATQAVTAGGDVSVTALETATIVATDSSSVIADGCSPFANDSGTCVGVNFLFVTNLVLSGAEAYVIDSTVTAGGDVAVTTANTSTISATIESETRSFGVSVGVVLAFNTVGVDSQNVLFNIADAILGLDIATSKPVRTVAAVKGSTLDAGGAIAVTTHSAAAIDATVESSSTSIKATLGDDAVAVAVDAVIAMNRLHTEVRASIDDSPSIEAKAGDLAVTASNAASITSLVDAPALAVAASLDKATGVTVGLSVSRNEIQTAMDARIHNVVEAKATGGNLLVSATESAVIDATSTASAITVAVSLEKSLAFSGGGATAVNSVKGRANATISSSRATATGSDPAGHIVVTALMNASIAATVKALAVAVAVSPDTTPAIAIGLSIARNFIGWNEHGGADPLQVKATTLNTRLSADTGITVSATGTATITAVVQATAVAVALGKTGLALSGGGLWTDNKIAMSIHASIGTATGDCKTGQTASVCTAAGGISVTASDSSTIEADAQAVSVSAALSGNFALALAIGLSLAHNTVDNDTLASIDGVAGISTGGSDVTVSVTQDATITVKSVAVAVSAALSIGSPAIAIAGGASESTNVVLSTANATIRNSTVGTSAAKVGKVSVTATGKSEIHALVLAVAAAVAFGSSTGVGVGLGIAVARNFIGHDPDPSTDSTVQSTDYLRMLETDTRVKIAAGGPMEGEVYEYLGADVTPRHDFTTSSTPTTLQMGHRVLVSSVDVDGNTVFDVYEYLGPGLPSPNLATQTYTDPMNWRKVSALEGQDYANPTLWQRVDLSPQPAQVRARVEGSGIQSSKEIEVSAHAEQVIDALVVAAAAGISGGGSTGVGVSGAGVYAENRILVDVEAILDAGGAAVSGTQLDVEAEDSSHIRAVAGAASLAAGIGGGVGVSIALGLSIAFNEVDADVVAAVMNAVVTTTSGAVNVKATSHGALLFKLTGVTADQLNDVSKADDDDADTPATADVTILRGIETSFKNAGHALTTGKYSTADVLQPIYTTLSGERDLKQGDTVRVEPGYAFGGTPGTVYVFVATNDDDVDLGAEIYTNILRWKPGLVVKVEPGDVVRVAATGLSYRYLGTTAAMLDLNAQNYLSVGTWEYVPPALTIVEPGNVWQLVSGTDTYLITKVETAGVTTYEVTRPTIDAIAVAASLSAAIGTTGVAIAGAGVFARNSILNTTNASIESSSVTSAAAVDLEAASTASISATIVAASFALGVAATAGVAASIGIAIAENLIGTRNEEGDRVPVEVRAFVKDSAISATGQLEQTATASQSITALVIAASGAVAAAGVAGVAFSGAGSVATNTIIVDVAATIEGDGSDSVRDPGRHRDERHAPRDRHLQDQGARDRRLAGGRLRGHRRRRPLDRGHTRTQRDRQ